MQLELIEVTPLSKQITLADILYGTVARDIAAKDKRLIMKVKPTGFLLNSNVVGDVLNRGDCFVVDLSTGVLYPTVSTKAVLPMDCKLQYHPSEL